MAEPWGKTVLVEFDDGIAWVSLHRPDKRNAMNPELNAEMCRVLDALETDERCGVLVLTGSGDSFSAGMDLREYFRGTDKLRHVERMRIYREAQQWQWVRLINYYKPTIAMVNGWCFGGAFTPLISCDLAISAEEATFGLSEINWGILPGGNVSKGMHLINRRDAMYYIMTGETFDGKKAASMGLVNEAVPLVQLRARTTAIARTLLEKNPTVLRQARIAFKNVQNMPWDIAADYLTAKNEQGVLIDPERGREQGLKQFLDDKSFVSLCLCSESICDLFGKREMLIRLRRRFEIRCQCICQPPPCHVLTTEYISRLARIAKKCDSFLADVKDPLRIPPQDESAPLYKACGQPYLLKHITAPSSSIFDLHISNMMHPFDVHRTMLVDSWNPTRKHLWDNLRKTCPCVYGQIA